jgi:DNA-binding IclR family transcriptional regulator
MALLAALPDAEVVRIAARDSDREAFPNFTESYLHEKVEETRAQGFALSDQDIVPGMTAVSMVVRDPWGRPFASLTCAAISPRLEAARRPEVVAMLRDGAAEIEALLAGRASS